MKSVDGQPSRAVSRNRSNRRPGTSGVRRDQFDRKVVFTGLIDLARYEVGHQGPDERDFRKVAEPANILHIEVPQQECRARREFNRREDEHLAQLQYGTASAVRQPG
jgi:hypothetical protein